MEIKTEHYTGTNCTGSDGGSNRTLTISNTGTTSDNGFWVYTSGLALALTTEYTVDHNSSSTVITFLKPVWNDQTIAVHYTQQITGIGSQATSDDFINGPLADFGVTVVRTPVTMSTNFHGDKTYTDGTNENIEVVFENPNKKFPLDRSGLTEVYDARMFTKSDQTINKYDKITYDSKVYRVDTVSKKNFDGNTMFKAVTLFYLKNE
jgi:hypothetical protein